MIFDKDYLERNEVKEVESAYAGFKESMLTAYEYFKKLRDLRPEGDCQEEPPDDINMYTKFEMLDDIFSSVKEDKLFIISGKEIEQRFKTEEEYDRWYDVELVKARDQIQINYEKFWFG